MEEKEGSINTTDGKSKCERMNMKNAWVREEWVGD